MTNNIFVIQFLVQLLCGEQLFLYRLGRKRSFALRMAVSVGILVLIAAVVPAQGEGIIGSSALYLGLFALSLLAMWVCYEEPFQNLLLCGIAGYTVQHLFYLIFTLLDRFAFAGLEQLGVPRVDPYSYVWTQTAQMDMPQLLLYLGIYGVLYAAILSLIYLAVFDRFDPLLKDNRNFKLGRGHLIWLSALLIFLDVISNMVTTHYTTQEISYALELSYNIFTCLMILLLLYAELSRSELNAELLGVQYMLQQSKKQYEVIKSTSELINIKYHDLRHRSEQAQGGLLFRGEQEELREMLDRYDVQIQTGCEILNVILTEKNRVCREKGIALSCMVDGTGFECMKPHHLYALLGNALDNAIEAVEHLEEEKRLIHVYIRRHAQIAHIHIENPCRQPVRMRNGLPLTNKQEKGFHGYGVLSMKAVAETYGGELVTRADGGIFSVDITLMLSEQKNDKKSDV